MISQDLTRAPGTPTPGRVRRSAVLGGALGALLLLVPLLVGGCSNGQARQIGPLADAHPGAEALGRAVVAALREADRASLERYLVTREEHRELLWNALPERSYFSFEYARDVNERNTRKAIQRALERYGSVPLEFVEIRFGEDPEVYPEFVLRRGAQLRVRHPESGEEGTLPILDVVLELGGGWKPMHYVE